MMIARCLLTAAVCFISWLSFNGQAFAYEITGEMVAETARDYVAKNMKLDMSEGRFTVERTSIPNDFTVPDGQEVYMDVQLPYGVRYNAMTVVNVGTYVNKRLFHQSVVRVRVHQYRNVVVLSRPLPAKHIVEAGDLRLEERDITTMRAGYFTEADKAVGMEVQRLLPLNTVLRTSMLGKPVIVARQTMVTLVSIVNGVKVAADGQALQDGREGQLIKVKNLATDKTLSGRVVDANTVDVSRR